MTKHFRDEDFVEKLRANDANALEEVVKAYSGHFFKAALGMGLSEEMAYDVAHSTWMTFFEIVKRFEGRSHVRTFLFGILYNKVSELRRQNSKFAKTDPIDEVMESRFLDNGHWKQDFSDPASFVHSVQTLEIIERCLDKLPLIQKAVFTMKVIEEEENDDICHSLDITSTNLRQLLYRGKNRLRECIERIAN